MKSSDETPGHRGGLSDSSSDESDEESMEAEYVDDAAADAMNTDG